MFQVSTNTRFLRLFSTSEAPEKELREREKEFERLAHGEIDEAEEAGA